MKKFAFLVAAAAAAIAAAPAGAATQVYSAPDGLAGNQAWTGTLGLNFDVNAPVKITDLGVFDSNADGLASDLFVTIFNRVTGTQLFAPVQFAAGTANQGGAYIFQDIADFILGPGQYQLAAYGYSNGEPNYNYGFIQSGNGGPITFNNVQGHLTAVSTSYTGTPGAFATQADDGTTRYGAGSFLASAVPEPGTWAMMLFGFGAVGYSLRRRKSAGYMRAQAV